MLQEPPRPIQQRRMNVPALAIEDMDSQALGLKRKLREWRVRQMKERDFEGEEFFGPQQVMSECIPRRIIELAHASKLTDTAVLVEKVQWCDTPKFADEILEIIHSVYLPQPLQQQQQSGCIEQLTSS
ncbi:hypothetical protein NP233_g2867 [Leucocoprinus birnbaumii]|uniref:Uncharacterized protein n=1 Tax=Leucocoprinus birnbaumii TaxID=56174 RepID=A0AAD5VZY7_9AGAR|nr:hypothetical protein NP233_g2867 [Leucocoprinus birnbaumii]